MISKITSAVIGAVFISSTMFVNLAGAQAEAPKSVSLEQVIERLIDQASDLKKGLIGLKSLSDEDEILRHEYVQFLDEALEYYQSLEVTPDGLNVRFLAAQLKNKRAGEFGDQLKKIADFLLLHQAQSVLATAESRFLRIRNDLERLIDLKVLKRDKAEFLLNDAHLLLVSADGLIEEAGLEDADMRGLLSEAVAKIKLAYKKFLEIANLLKEALK